MNIAIWLSHPEIDCWNLSGAQFEKLVQRIAPHTATLCQNRDSFLEALPEANLAVVWRFEPEWLGRAPKLGWIATPAAGRDYFHVPEGSGIRLTYGSFHGEIMAETVLAFLLSHARGLTQLLGGDFASGWPRAELAPRLGTLRGRHLVVLGFGNIGGWIGRLAGSLGMRVTGVVRDTTRTEATGPREHADRVVSISELDSVLPDADYLTLCLPHSESTDHIIDARRLALLPSHSVLVNVGRGNAVDEVALIAALRSGALSAAYLDVFEKEPLPDDSPLRSAPGVVCMPHASAIAPQYLDLYLEELANEIGRREA